MYLRQKIYSTGNVVMVKTKKQEQHIKQLEVFNSKHSIRVKPSQIGGFDFKRKKKEKKIHLDLKALGIHACACVKKKKLNYFFF